MSSNLIRSFMFFQVPPPIPWYGPPHTSTTVDYDSGGFPWMLLFVVCVVIALIWCCGKEKDDAEDSDDD